MGSDSVFARLISPLSIDAFKQTVWQQTPLIHSRHCEEYYDSIFSLAGFEDILDKGRFRGPEIRIISKGSSRTDGYLKADGRLDKTLISGYFLDGYSIVVHGVDNFSMSVAAFIQAMQLTFSCEVRANGYLTPARTQALNPHYDSHDVFILQIAGSKNWRIYHAAAACPLDGTVQPPFGRNELPDPREVTLKIGDLIYIPRGWVHDSDATDENSLHLTIGLHPTQWVDFLTKSLIALSINHEPLRKSLPMGFLNGLDIIPRLQAQLEEFAELFRDRGSAMHAFSIAQDDFIHHSVGVDAGNAVDKIGALGGMVLASRLQKRPFLYSRVIYSGNEVAIQFHNKIVNAPHAYADAFEFVSTSNGVFAVADIANLDDERKIAVAKRLVRDGLLVMAVVPENAVHGHVEDSEAPRA
jgi:ribosomal protein L16 Arg81 hydroxylase